MDDLVEQTALRKPKGKENSLPLPEHLHKTYFTVNTFKKYALKKVPAFGK